ncbi:FAD-binding oxidoreductase [Desulfobacterota bacterium AH_259_B03_O07]|nr:FAD-binding oxidoreductase [Desulfobacterota bacterium AH_259_B03_O07]
MLLRPGDPGYALTGLPTNLAFVGIRPQGIVLSAGPADVKTSVGFAREHGLPAVARSGGHSYAGYSTTPGLLVDLSLMDTIKIDPSEGIADIGAGALLDAVDNVVAPFDITVPAARCATVGIAGLLLGGGFGFSARKFGLTSDNLVRTQIVTADGELRNCNERENPDLYWACRGGGGGNFGINVAFQVSTHPVSTVSVYRLKWGVKDDLAAAWSAMQDVAFTAPDDFSLRLGITINEEGPLPGASNELMTALGQFFGPAVELRDLLAPVFDAAPPKRSTIEELSFADATIFLELQDTPDAFLTKSAYMSGPLPDQGIATVLDFIRRFPPDSRDGNFHIFTWGGEINRVPPDATAFVHRSAAFLVESDSSWHTDDPQSVVDASKDWIEEFFDSMQPFFTGSAYQNFMDPTLVEWQSAYYGANFPRLVDVKRTYDPDNFFNLAQSIPTQI